MVYSDAILPPDADKTVMLYFPLQLHYVFYYYLFLGIFYF